MNTIYQKNLINDLIKNKDIYLSEKIKDIMGIKEYFKFNQLYEVFFERVKDYESKKLEKKSAGYDYAQTYRREKNKVNPFVAGVIGEAIGGVGGGVYAAISADERNKEIEDKAKENMRDRFIYGGVKYRAEKEFALAEEKLIEIVKEIDKILNDFPDIKKYKEKEERRKDYEAVRKKKLKKQEYRNQKERKQLRRYIAIVIFICVLFLIGALAQYYGW